MNKRDEHKPPEWFQEWREPLDLFDEAQWITTGVPKGEIFRNPTYQFAFDAYGAGKSALIFSTENPCLVRCLPHLYPDFALKFGDREIEYELTEADRDDRRRGDEYRKQAEQEEAGLPQEHEMFDPGEEQQAAYLAVERAVALKASKHYQPKAELVVLVNLWSFDLQEVDWERLRNLTEPHRSEFPAIWILWGNRLFQCWPKARTIIDPKPRYAEG